VKPLREQRGDGSGGTKRSHDSHNGASDQKGCVGIYTCQERVKQGGDKQSKRGHLMIPEFGQKKAVEKGEHHGEQIFDAVCQGEFTSGDAEILGNGDDVKAVEVVSCTTATKKLKNTDSGDNPVVIFFQDVFHEYSIRFKSGKSNEEKGKERR